MVGDYWYGGGEVVLLMMTNGLPNGMASFDGYWIFGLDVFDDGDGWF